MLDLGFEPLLHFLKVNTQSTKLCTKLRRRSVQIFESQTSFGEKEMLVLTLSNRVLLMSVFSKNRTERAAYDNLNSLDITGDY